jgi:DNA-binding transcriptional MerR regulator
MERRNAMTIGAVAKATGCNIRTIRYYESVGLLAPPERTAGNQRVYDHGRVERLAFIRRARALGFPLDDIRELLGLSDQPDRPCASIDAVARRHADAVATRIEQLSRLKAELDRMVAHCAGGRVADCRIVRMLAAEDSTGADPTDALSEEEPAGFVPEPA